MLHELRKTTARESRLDLLLKRPVLIIRLPTLIPSVPRATRITGAEYLSELPPSCAFRRPLQAGHILTDVTIIGYSRGGLLRS